jgi:hypothetical protein
VRATSQIATFESLDSAERREAIRLAIDKRDADYGEKEQALLELFAGFMRQGTALDSRGISHEPVFLGIVQAVAT